MPQTKKKERFIPFFLQRKLQKEKGEVPVDGSPGRRPGAPRQRRASSVDSQKTFSAPHLEDLIWKTSQTIVELQKQIQRGEETYYEETQTHGSSLFRGFETFIDARDVGTSSGPPASSSRRMPGDYRWFSSSCSNISLHMKQRLFVPTAPPPAAAKPATAAPSEKTTTAEPLSGQKRPASTATTAASSPPSKERKIEESTSSPTAEDVKTPKEDKGKAAGRTPASATKSGETKRRTTRKRKANA